MIVNMYLLGNNCISNLSGYNIVIGIMMYVHYYYLYPILLFIYDLVKISPRTLPLAIAVHYCKCYQTIFTINLLQTNLSHFFSQWFSYSKLNEAINQVSLLHTCPSIPNEGQCFKYSCSI